MIGPVVGLYVFGERETLARRDDSISPSGPGALLVALSFRLK
jgi:hypothetical protein